MLNFLVIFNVLCMIGGCLVVDRMDTHHSFMSPVSTA